MDLNLYCRAAVPASRELAERASRTRAEERAVVGLAIVIAGGAERAREHENQEGGRRREERGPPRGPRPEPGVLQRSGSGGVRIDEQERRVERRQVRLVIVVRALERCPGGVHHEAAQAENGEERPHPPAIGACGCRESDDVAARARCLCHRSPSVAGTLRRGGILT